MKVTCPCCETSFDPEKSKTARSTPQHRRFFALCRQAFFHWPESNKHQFTDENECRKWLQMRSGWRDIAARIPVVGLNMDRLVVIIEAAFKAVGVTAVLVGYKGDLIIWTPQSIAYAKMEHSEFCKLNDAVETTIEQEVGVKVEQLLTEKAA